MSLVVFRPVADGYQVVGVSATETLTANSLNTFTLAGPIPVQAGDILGSWAADSTNCLFATDSAWDMASFSLASLPSVGDVVASSGGLEYYRVNISATLTAAAPSAQDQIAALKAKIIGWNLKRDTSAELREPLTEALAALRQHERADAIGAMRDFIQTVRDQPRRALSQSQAAELISDAQAIIATLRSS